MAHVHANGVTVEEGYVHLYQPMLRPASSSSLPRGVFWEYVETPRAFFITAYDRASKLVPSSRFLYGVIALSRELTPEEREHFDLKPVDSLK